MSKKILVAEDNPRDRDYLSKLLNSEELTLTDSGPAALEANSLDQFENIICDIQMPGFTGIELAKRIWSQFPNTKILFWSHYDDEMYLRTLSSIVPHETVYGYVLKTNSSDVIVKAVESVFDDQQCWIDPKIRPIQARVNQQDSKLSDVEYETLLDISLGLTDNAIAHRRYLSRRGVQNRLKSLYQKMELDPLQIDEDHLHEVINLRARTLSVAFRRGLINTFILEEEEKALQEWLKSISRL